jgi:hypothetical protein
MKKILFVIIGVILPLALLAATVAVTWTNPTQNTDATPIPASGAGSIASTRIAYGTCTADKSAIATVAGNVVVQGVAQAGSLTNLTPGTWCAQAFTSNTYGMESVGSNVANKVVAAPTPNPPSNFSLN